MPGFGPRRIGAEFVKAPGDNALQCRSKHRDFPRRKKKLEAESSGFILIRVKPQLRLKSVAADSS